MVFRHIILCQITVFHTVYYIIETYKGIPLVDIFVIKLTSKNFYRINLNY